MPASATYGTKLTCLTLSAWQALYQLLAANPCIDLDIPRAQEGSLAEAITRSLRTPGALLHRTIEVGSALITKPWPAGRLDWPPMGMCTHSAVPATMRQGCESECRRAAWQRPSPAACTCLEPWG